MIKPEISAIQMRSTNDVNENLATAAQLISAAAQHGAKLIVLPEMFALMGANETDKLEIKEVFGRGKIQSFLAKQAATHQVWIVGGTIPIAATDKNKVRAACLVYNTQGHVVARHDKIHLFDVALSESETYRESSTIEPGDELVVIDTPFGKLGIAICYELRFPGLFTYLFNLGAEIIAVPSAFTVKTGSAHWHLLTRARALDTFSYIIGACQEGEHANGRKTYGHSLIVDPWGNIIQEKTDAGPGVVYGEIDLEFLHKIRRSIPTAKHQKISPDISKLKNNPDTL